MVDEMRLATLLRTPFRAATVGCKHHFRMTEPGNLLPSRGLRKNLTMIRNTWTLLSRFVFFLLLVALTSTAASAQTVPDVDKDTAFRWLDANAETMRNMSANIWSAAETSLHEYRSSRELMAFLESNGLRVEKGIAGMPTAFVASYGSGKPVVAIYGEYDALAGLSQKAEAAISPVLAGAPGHGCGHNLQASSAAAAVALAKWMQAKQVAGTLRFYGTPAEESLGGKNYMSEAGAFDDVDVLLGWHSMNTTRTGFDYSKAVASVRFKFKGVAAHASVAPQLGRSALKGVELLDIGVNFMREHLDEDARIHSVITDGGGQPNVVPASAESWYYIRANKHQDVAKMFDWISEIAKGAAMMTRTEVQITVDDDSHELLPNRPLAEIMQRNLDRVGAPKFTDEEKGTAQQMQKSLKTSPQLALPEQIEPLPDKPGQGLFSTDLGNVSWKVPSTILYVASYPYGVPIHSWQVTACSGMSIGHKAMTVGAKTLTGTVIDLFRHPELIGAAKKDLQERKKNYAFRLLTPPNRKPPIVQESQ